MAFESYTLAVGTDYGSFLSARYKNSSIQKIAATQDNTGSVVLIIER